LKELAFAGAGEFGGEFEIAAWIVPRLGSRVNVVAHGTLFLREDLVIGETLGQVFADDGLSCCAA